MSIERYRNDNPRSAEEVAEAIADELRDVNSSAPVIRGTQNYAFVQSMATTLSEQQEESLSDLYDASYIADASDTELTKRASELGVRRQSAVAATGVVTYERDSPASQDRTISAGTLLTTGGEDPVRFQSTSSATIEGPSTESDSNTYSTSSTSFTSLVSFTIDVTYRESIDVSADLNTTDGTYEAFLDIVDATAGASITTGSTTNTTQTAVGPTSYDVSGKTGDITIEFQARIENSAASAEVTNATVDLGGETGARANIIAEEAGSGGNVGAETISTFVNRPAGVNGVTNNDPVGDPQHFLLDGTTRQRLGQPREDDTSLRERALSSTAVGGAGTAAAAKLALENIEDVVSADVLTNRSNTTTNNIDPWHTEVRVFGGDILNIAEELYDVLPLNTLRSLDGGANGTAESTTINKGDLYGDITISITRPTEVTLNITVDLVHTAAYGGTNEVKNAIVEYTGGTTTDARSVAGLGQNENIIVNEVENVVEDVAGVDAVTNSIIDDNDDGSDDTTTDSDGVRVYPISGSEVPTVDAANITVNETAR